MDGLLALNLSNFSFNPFLIKAQLRTIKIMPSIPGPVVRKDIDFHVYCILHPSTNVTSGVISRGETAINAVIFDRAIISNYQSRSIVSPILDIVTITVLSMVMMVVGISVISMGFAIPDHVREMSCTRREITFHHQISTLKIILSFAHVDIASAVIVMILGRIARTHQEMRLGVV